MTALSQLLRIVASLDSDGPDYQMVREAQRLAKELEGDGE